MSRNNATSPPRHRPGQGTAKSILTLAGGSAAGQIVGLLASFALARLYAPSDFGAVALLLSASAILAILATGRLELAIPLPSNADEARSVAVAGFALTSIVVVLAGALLAVLSKTVDAFLNPLGVTWFVPLVMVASFGTAATSLMSFWAIRNGDFRRLSLARFSSPAGTASAQVTMSGLGASGLMYGAAIGLLIPSLILSHPRRWMRKFPSTSDVWAGLSRYRRFPLISTWAALIGSFGLYLIPVLLVSTAGVAAAGYFALAQRIVAGPVQLVGGSIGEVVYRQAAQANRESTLGTYVLNVHHWLSRLALPAALISVPLWPDAFALLYGPEWREAGVYAAILTPMFYLSLLNQPIGSVFLVREKQHLSLIFQTLMSVLRIGGVVIGGWWGDALGAVIGLSAGGSIGYIAFLLSNNRVAGNALGAMLGDAVRATASGTVVVSPILIALVVPMPAPFAVAMAGLGAITMGCWYLYWLRKFGVRLS